MRCERNGLVGVVYNSSMFDMALYRYFSVPTRVSMELEKENTIVYGGCGLVTFGHAARHHTCIA